MPYCRKCRQKAGKRICRIKAVGVCEFCDRLRICYFMDGERDWIGDGKVEREATLDDKVIMDLVGSYLWISTPQDPFLAFGCLGGFDFDENGDLRLHLGGKQKLIVTDPSSTEVAVMGSSDPWKRSMYKVLNLQSGTLHQLRAALPEAPDGAKDSILQLLKTTETLAMEAALLISG
jgi:hypothetical protein